jgi:Holliday junction DNA helicase RuvA
MIERIRGKLIDKNSSFVIVDCSGVGYGINISLPTSEKLPEAGEEVTLLTHLVVREDLMQLYGFADTLEKDLFLLLISVSKIGPKTALSTLSGMPAYRFVNAIKTGDITALTKIPGIGKQTAERVVVELKNKIDKIIVSPFAENGNIEQRGIMGKPYEEAVLALTSLGYKGYNSEKAVRRVYEEKGKDLPVEEIIKFALKYV